MTGGDELLDRLPTELLDIITIGHIEKYDIVTHANLYRASQRVRTHYDARHDDRYWQIQCFMNGVGYVDIRDPSPELMSWEAVAFEVADHAITCDGLCCGRVQLEDNRRSMLEQLEKFPDLATAPLAMSRYQNNHILDSYHVTMFQYITFRPSFVDDKRAVSWLNEPRDRPYLYNFRPSKPGYEALFEHPIAFRSFAVFPPIRRTMLVDKLSLSFPSIDNKHGVTIADVCGVFLSRSANVLSSSAIGSALVGIDSAKDGFSVLGWSFQDHLHALARGTVGGWFRILKSKGFIFDADPDGDMFYPEFEERELPKSFREFEDELKASLRAERGCDLLLVPSILHKRQTTPRFTNL